MKIVFIIEIVLVVVGYVAACAWLLITEGVAP